MEASRRHETPGSDTRYFIAHSIANNVKFIFASVPVAPVPCPTGVMRTRWGKRCVHSGFESQLGNTEFRNPNLWSSKSVSTLSWRETLSFSYWTGNNRALCLWEALSIFQFSLLYKAPWKDSLKGKLFVRTSVPKTCKTRRYPGNLSPNNDRWATRPKLALPASEDSFYKLIEQSFFCVCGFFSFFKCHKKGR